MTTAAERRRILASSDYVGIIRAVCESPGDDLPRLVAADWLEENGQPNRARLIRCQLELAATADPGLAAALEFEASALMSLMRTPDGWRYVAGREPPEPEYSWGRTAYLWRGFVERISLPASSFLSCVREGMFGEQPVTAVRLTDKEPLSTSLGFIWGRPGDTACGAVLPPAASANLPVEIAGDDEHWRAHLAGVFLTREKAMEALSDACIRYGRRAANLPPLTGPEGTP